MNWKIDRRKFLSLTGTAIGGIAIAPNTLFSNPSSKIRFGLITDSHYADRATQGTRFYRQSLDKMSECIQVFNDEKVDFVIHLGDFKDEDPNQRTEDTLRYLNAIEAEFARFNGPRFHCIGNHDVDSITKQQFLANIKNTGIPKDKSYYAFDQKGFHFVVLDANFDSNGNDHFYKEGANWQDTNIPKMQRDWLINDLEQTKLPTIVFCHHPLFEYMLGASTMHVQDYESIQKIMVKSGKVKASIHGHVHEEKYAHLEGIQYISQLGMVDNDGLENNSFAIITCNDSELQIEGYKRTTDKLMSLK
ncbi:MAG: alkaline phosphatase [Roseivirga sp.]|jgi:alkaline phosphatase